MNELVYASEQISLFCRLIINSKRDLPIRSGEMGLLIYLCKTDGDKTPLTAAQFFKVSKAMATNMITSLVKKGYIDKSPSPNDRRSFLLHPTKKAELLVDTTYQEYHKTMSLLKQGMGDNDFNLLLAQLVKANEILLGAKNNG